MDTKTVAVITTFTALTIALNLSPIKISAPYAPYLVYQIWEIPIVAAFLLYGVKAGATIAIINTAVLFAVFPGMLPTGPLYNLVAIASMLSGIIIVEKFAEKNLKKHRETFSYALSTALGIIFRVGIMTFVNWAFLRFPPPVGFGMTEEAILIALPFIAFFNATLALYTIPLGYCVAKAAKMSVKTTD
jgi:riboflavin transporter FmnP